ncbi:hypothetical protein ACFQI7_25915 [Paenibacillus allorhizosphaerae]|uniref:Uncharacterized protein n=1 Tax=Paenibacillus allorhizosphaerae TaxID=2849866 RepID=A0ABM8VJJ9_9BACL|nr:hypothetical protein [Paenibacillus allorhizosphaerae]CAG7645607.1 hypothetical protein PAECIP111802_03559 [Paenibacillus allorhizosphaerae]
MRNKKTIMALCVSASLLLSTSAFAAYTPDLARWAMPDEVHLEGFNRADVILDTNAELSWTADQLSGFPVKGQLGVGRFLPSFAYQVDEGRELQPQVMVSNLPGAKFTRTPADKDGGDRIKVSVLGAAYLQADMDYTFYTGWQFSGSKEGKPKVTLSSLQEFDQGAGGGIHEQTETERALSGLRWKQFEQSSTQRDKEITAAFNRDPFYFTREHDETFANDAILKGYSSMDSKAALDQYKSDAAKRLKAAQDCCSPVRFAITLNKYVGFNKVAELAKDYRLNITQYYAAGERMGSSSKDEYTISWFDPKWDRPFSLISKAVGGFATLQVTELEGTARVDDLKRISSIPEVNVVDMEDRGKRPTGVYWLNKRFSESK